MTETAVTTATRMVHPPSPAGSDLTTNSDSTSAVTRAVGSAEISAAIEFLGRHLNSPQSQLTATQTREFLAALTDHLSLLVSSSTWIPSAPHFGSARRCLLNTTRKLDKTLWTAADQLSIPSLLVLNALPADLALWIDPGSVVYRQGSDHAPLVVVWEDSYVAHQRLVYQHHITSKWSQSQTPSPPIVSTVMSPVVVSSPLLINANAILPQKSKVVMKIPSSARATTSSSIF